MVQIEFSITNQILEVFLRGNFIHFNDDNSIAKLMSAASSKNIRQIHITASSLEQWDTSLATVLFNLYKLAAHRQIDVTTSNMPSNLQRLVRLALLVNRKPPQNKEVCESFFASVGSLTLVILANIKKTFSFIIDVWHSIKRLFSAQATMRKIDWLYALEDCTYRAVGIVSLVSFMVGLILAFVGAIQLKSFGAQIYVSSLVAIGMTRIMGAIMVGVVMAGRTGAAYAASIGSMQVNEEVDALKTMGISSTDFLVLPRITALVLSMPILTILADFMGILGGFAVGVLTLNIPPEEYLLYTHKALSLTNFWVGIFHSFVFGIIISLCGCFYGINCGRNADSVGFATTKAVVSSIVWMIVATGFITLIFEVLGI